MSVAHFALGYQRKIDLRAWRLLTNARPAADQSHPRLQRVRKRIGNASSRAAKGIEDCPGLWIEKVRRNRPCIVETLNWVACAKQLKLNVEVPLRYWRLLKRIEQVEIWRLKQDMTCN